MNWIIIIISMLNASFKKFKFISKAFSLLSFAIVWKSFPNSENSFVEKSSINSVNLPGDESKAYNNEFFSKRS